MVQNNPSLPRLTFMIGFFLLEFHLGPVLGMTAVPDPNPIHQEAIDLNLGETEYQEAIDLNLGEIKYQEAIDLNLDETESPESKKSRVFYYPDCPSFPYQPDQIQSNCNSIPTTDSLSEIETFECCLPVYNSDAFNCIPYNLHSECNGPEAELQAPFEVPSETQAIEKPIPKKFELNEPRSWDCDCTNEAVQMASIPDLILSSRLNPSVRRYSTFKRALELLFKYNAKVLVETGTARHGNNLSCFNDGCSTMFFGHYAFLTKSMLYSVDISPASCHESIKSTEQFRPHVTVVLSDSLKYLEEFNHGLVDFIYLDSFDWSQENSQASQMHHLEEIKRIYPKLHRRSIVLIDDCSLAYGGKCAMVHDFLMEQGWTMIMKDYQQLYIYQS